MHSKKLTQCTGQYTPLSRPNTSRQGLARIDTKLCFPADAVDSAHARTVRIVECKSKQNFSFCTTIAKDANQLRGFAQCSLPNPHPDNPNHNIQPLALSSLVLETPHPILLIVPVRATSRMHSPPASIPTSSSMLYYRAVDNILVLRLRLLGGRLLNQLLQDRVDDRSVPIGRVGMNVRGCGLER